MASGNTLDADFSSFAAALDEVTKSATSPAMERRIQAERAATKSPKERARKPVRTIQVNFRISAAEKAMLKALSAELTLSDTDTVVKALTDLAKKHKIAGG